MKLLLVVEDDDDLRSALAGIFALAGYQVEAVRDGSIAWERVRLDPLPAAVVLDLSMPRLDGRSLRARMLTEPRTRDIPVIICTGSVDDDVDVPESTVLRKPIDLDQLLEALRKALHER